MRGDYGWKRSAGMAARRSVAGWLSLAVVAVLVVGVDPAFGALSPTPDRSYGTDGLVTAAVQSGNTIYLGGTFTTIGPPSEPGVVLPPSSGTPEAGWPSIDGGVSGAVDDGAGGWYIAGQFHRVGNLRRPGLAHILSDKSVDPAFNPLTVSFSGSTAGLVEPQTGGAPGGQTLMVLAGSTLYVAPRAGTPAAVLAFDAKTGATRAFSPAIDGNVNGMVASGTTLFIGGAFQHVGGQGRAGLAAIDLASGAVTAWNPGISGVPPNLGPGMTPAVFSLAISGGTVYVAGLYASIGGQSRTGLAAVSASDGTPTGWMPQPTPNSTSDYFLSVGLSGSALYTSGARFGSTKLAAFSLSDGSQTAWNPSLPASADASTIRPVGDTIYLGGNDSQQPTAGGGYSTGLLAVDATTGSRQSWSPIVDASVAAIASGPSGVFIGGYFNSVGGVPRHGLAAIDATTGKSLSFDPGGVDTAPGNAWNVRALALSGSTLYVGGHFDHLGTMARGGLGAVDLASGAVTGWDPNARLTTGQAPFVTTMSLSGSTLYFAGIFDSVGGVARANGAAVSVTDASVTPWNPGLERGVFAITASDAAVYLGGHFSTVGGQSLANLAAVNTTDGAPVPNWNPNPNRETSGLALAGSTLYASGSFTSIGGQARRGFATLDAVSGALAPPQGATQGSTGTGLIVDGSRAFTVGRQIDANSGAVDPWRPVDAGSPLLLTTTGRLVVSARGYEIYSPLTGPPTALTGVELVGSPQPTGALACNPAVFDGAYTTSYQWLRDGAPIPGRHRSELRHQLFGC